MVSNDGVVGDGMSPTTSSKVTPPKGKPSKQAELKGGCEVCCDINGKETINRKKRIKPIRNDLLVGSAKSKMALRMESGSIVSP